MRNYTKPSVEIIELQINENIAALVPKTIYKSSSKTGTLTADTELTFSDESNFGETSII